MQECEPNMHEYAISLLEICRVAGPPCLPLETEVVEQP